MMLVDANVLLYATTPNAPITRPRGSGSRASCPRVGRCDPP